MQKNLNYFFAPFFIFFIFFSAVQTQWSSKTPMPTIREGLTSSVVNNVIYAIGGFNGVGLP